MSDFRTRILGLAAMGMAMAGASYGQQLACGTPNTTSNIVISTGITATLRAESQTELVQDVTSTGTGCTATTATQGIVYVTLNATVTSKTTTSPSTEATLLICATAPCTVANATATYPGTVSGNTVVFVGVSFPTTFYFDIANVLVNAATATTPTVTESVNIEYTSAQSNTGSANLITGALPVGYVQTSFSFSLATINGTSPTYNSYTVCQGNPLALPFTTVLQTGNGATGSTNQAFTINVKELTPGAFRTQLQESGSDPATGAATSADQIVITLANVPSVATVYLPLTVTAGTAPNATTLTLVNPSSGASLTAATGAFFTGIPYPVVSFTPSSGTVTATYAVTSAVTSTQLTFPIPVEMTFAAYAASVQTTPVTVLAAYGPAAATLTGPATAVPTFAMSSATPLNVSTISPCLTTLLFPYVTNYQGTYETGMAIANTTTDNLGAGGKSTATASSGTCTINFYGNQAQPAAVTTPTVGAWSTASGSPSPIYANTLSAMTGLTNFTGYAIAQCNFLDAHGFAFITDYTLGGADAFAQGYLAIVVPNVRTGPDGGDGE